MVTEVPFEGFAYDVGKAEAMADAIDAVFKQADLAGPSAPDKLAALGIAAALVIIRTRLKTAPKLAADRLAAYIVAQVNALAAPGQPGS